MLSGIDHFSFQNDAGKSVYLIKCAFFRWLIMFWQKIGNSVSDRLFCNSVRDSVIAENQCLYTHLQGTLQYRSAICYTNFKNHYTNLNHLINFSLVHNFTYIILHNKMYYIISYFYIMDAIHQILLPLIINFLMYSLWTSAISILS